MLEYNDFLSKKAVNENRQTTFKSLINLCKEKGVNTPEEILYCCRENGLNWIFFINKESVSAARFGMIKVFMSNLFEYLEDNGIEVLPEEYEKLKSMKYVDFISSPNYSNSLKKKFYKNLDEVLEEVSSISKKEDYSFTTDLYTKVLIILFWNGVLASEMEDIKKTDINHETKCIRISGKNYYFDKKYFSIIESFSLQKIFFFQNSKIEIKDGDDRLFPRLRGTDQKTTSCYLYWLKKYDLVAKKDGKSFKTKSLSKNGQFCNILEEEKNGSFSDDVIRDCLYTNDSSKVYRFKLEYEAWKRVFGL